MLSAASVWTLAPAKSSAANVMPALIITVLLFITRDYNAVCGLFAYTLLAAARRRNPAGTPECSPVFPKKSRTSSVRLGLHHCLRSGETFFLGFVEQQPGLAFGIHVHCNLATARETS